MQLILIPTMQVFYHTQVLCMQDPRLVSSPYVCMQVGLIPNEYIFFNTEFLCIQNKTYYYKMEYFVRKRLCICCSAQPPPGSLFSLPLQQLLLPKFDYSELQPKQGQRSYGTKNPVRRNIPMERVYLEEPQVTQPNQD